jgi:hypothetical protein
MLLARCLLNMLSWRVWIGELDSVTTCTHHSKLRVITLSLISALYAKLHAKCSLSCSVSDSRSLATASNNWTRSADLGSSLYSLMADVTENTASNMFSIVCYGRLSSDSLDIVFACLPNRCSETVVCLCAYCIGTAALAVCCEIFA